MVLSRDQLEQSGEEIIDPMESHRKPYIDGREERRSSHGRAKEARRPYGDGPGADKAPEQIFQAWWCTTTKEDSSKMSTEKSDGRARAAVMRKMLTVGLTYRSREQQIGYIKISEERQAQNSWDALKTDAFGDSHYCWSKAQQEGWPGKAKRYNESWGDIREVHWGEKPYLQALPEDRSIPSPRSCNLIDILRRSWSPVLCSHNVNKIRRVLSHLQYKSTIWTCDIFILVK